MTKSQSKELDLHSDIGDDVIAEALRSVEKYKRRKAEEGHLLDLEETIESVVVPEELGTEGEAPFEVPIAEIARSLDTPEPPPPVPPVRRAPEPALSDSARQLIDRLKTRTVELTREVQTLEAQLQDKTAEAQKNHERMVWMQAELENAKKRHAREKGEIERYGAEKIVREVLPVLDNLDRALQHAQSSPDPQVLSEGVQMTLTQFHSCLRRLGVTRIELSPGHPFDPALHEAMMQEESELPPNSVVREMQAGYLLQDRLLRASLVTVARPASRPNAPASSPDVPIAASVSEAPTAPEAAPPAASPPPDSGEGPA
jgi:molecular chaperone GrpE